MIDTKVTRRLYEQIEKETEMEISKDTLKDIYTTNSAGLLAYIIAVGEKIGKEEALRIHARVHAGMAEIVGQNLSRLGIEGQDARTGMALIDSIMEEHYPGINEMMERERSEDTPKRVVSRQKGWCPTLAACEMLGISPRDFCPIPHIEGLTPLVQVIHPKLQVKLGKIRPEAEYCELIVELND